MLQKVCKTTLVIVLIDGTYLLGNVETCHVLGIFVVANVIGESIGKMTNLDIFVDRNQC